jgi:hypothetical protein
MSIIHLRTSLWYQKLKTSHNNENGPKPNSTQATIQSTNTQNLKPKQLIIKPPNNISKQEHHQTIANNSTSATSSPPNTARIMFKFTSTTFTLFVAAASQLSVCAQNDNKYIDLGFGGFHSCPNSGEFFQGMQTISMYGPRGLCIPYPGQPLAASASAAASVSAAVADPGLNGWSCYPPGTAECPPGYAIADLCISRCDSYGCQAGCADYCTTPGFFAMKCIPNPITDVPLNSGEWLPIGSCETDAMCDEGSVLCGLCYSNNPNDCQGEMTSGKCCKYQNFLRKNDLRIWASSVCLPLPMHDFLTTHLQYHFWLMFSLSLLHLANDENRLPPAQCCPRLLGIPV